MTTRTSSPSPSQASSYACALSGLGLELLALPNPSPPPLASIRSTELTASMHYRLLQQRTRSKLLAEILRLPHRGYFLDVVFADDIEAGVNE